MRHDETGRILIVDDEVDLVTALCRLLEAQGYSTTGVATGAQALEALGAAMRAVATRFDILITDLMMPQMNGVVLLREALAIDPDLVAIVMTGHGTIQTAVEAMKGGALDYILKPFNLSVVMPVLTRAIAMRRLRLENAALLGQVASRTAQLENSNRQLQIANKDLDAFNASLSHDVRGHLNRIIGFSQILSDEEEDPLTVRQRELLSYVCVGGKQLLRLTDDLLRLARLGQQSIVKQDIDVVSLVHQICLELQVASPDRPVTLRVGALPHALADPALFRQVWTNLLANAFKFTRLVPEPIIEVTGQVQAGEATYCVRDNGAGFDMAHASRLFADFHRLHSDSEFEGTGLGLAIVRRVLERHGGAIHAEATVGMGAAFTFTLPV